MKPKKIVYIFFVVLIFFLIVIGWSFFIEPYIIKVERVSFEIKNLPSSFEKIKIVHLSDFHSRNFGKREQKLLKIVDELNPDFIFITGDIVDWTTRDFDSCQVFWKELSQNHEGRVFGVYGNHEHRNPRFSILKNALKESKIEILDNESRKINVNEDFVYLIGVDDPHLGFDDIEKAMKDVEDDAPKILLAHSPEIFRKVKEMDVDPHTKNSGVGIDLVLVGHTHGGQINIPWLVDFIIPLKYDKKYKRGLFKENSTYLYVNRGIGLVILPLRFNSFPEITLIKLTRP